jgi:hypothetical protein
MTGSTFVSFIIVSILMLGIIYICKRNTECIYANREHIHQIIGILDQMNERKVDILK